MSFQACDYSVACSLRLISQHQKNGVLEIGNERDRISISIIEGVIVGAVAQSKPLNYALVERMKRASLIDAEDKDIDLLLNSPSSKLYQRLVGGGYLSHEMFVRLKFTYERDILDSLINFRSEQVDFRPQFLQADEALSQRIFPCQLLLDFLEIEIDERRFADTFGSDAMDRVFVRPQVANANGLTETEQTVWDLIGRGTYLEDIFATSILSIHQAQDALLALHEQHFISIGEAEPQVKVVEEVEIPDTTLNKELVSDEPYLIDDDLQLASEDMESDLNLNAIDAESLNNVSVVFRIPENAAEPYAHENSNAAYIVTDESTLQERNEEVEQVTEERNSKSGKGPLGLTSDDFLHRYQLASMVFFLLLLGVVLPKTLADLFEAIAFFVGG